MSALADLLAAVRLLPGEEWKRVAEKVEAEIAELRASIHDSRNSALREIVKAGELVMLPAERATDPDCVVAAVAALRAARNELRRGVVANAGLASKHGTLPRWARVMRATGSGSTRAYEACIDAGFDPEEMTCRR